MDVGSLSPASILLNLFTQLFPQNGHWAKDFHELISRKDRHDPPPARLRDLYELIRRACNYHRRVSIAVDALDECNEAREELLILLRDLGQVKGVSAFVTSRKEHDIGVAFEGFPSISLTGLKDKIEVDMEAYICDEMQKRRGLARLPDHLRTKVAATLIEKADGM